MTFVLSFVAIQADAQRYTAKKRYGSWGITIGAINYFGDIVPQPDFTSLRFKSTRPNVGINYTYRYAPRVSFRGALQWGRLLGSDALSASVNEGENIGRFKRNLSFRNDLKEVSAVAIIDLFENRQTYLRRPDFVPYGFVGIAVFHHNPQAYYENGSRPGLDPAYDIPTGWYELQPLGTEGQYASSGGDYPEAYKRVQISIPFGLGVRYKLNRHWDMSLEVGWRKTFTDYLDDASSAWVDKSVFLNEYGGSNPIAAVILSDRSAESGFNTQPDPSGTVYDIVPGYGTSANKKRGTKSDMDWYITSNLSLNYIIQPRVRSPKFR